MRHRKTLEPLWLGPMMILCVIVYCLNATAIIVSFVWPKQHDADCSEEAPDMVPAEFFPPAQP